MNTPLVSIIIPTFNRTHLIGETLDSVLAQTYTNWECIIVDDGSSDHTDEVVEAYVKKDKRFQYHHRPETHKPGGNGARNYGFELSKGEYVNWFDSDDLMLEDFIKAKIEAFTDELYFVICSGSYWNSNDNSKENIELKVNSCLFQDYVMWKTHILTPSVLIKKHFLSDKELFSDKITRGQETELFSRLFFELPEDKYKIINIPLFLYRQHEQTKTHSNNKYIKSYKESQTFIAVENLKKSIKIENKLLINYYYKGLLDLFFRAVENNHKQNAEYILDNLPDLIKKLNKKLSFQIYCFGKLSVFLNRGSYRIEKHLKSYSF
ncbi:glycosyltransferase family 2 protein [Flavobacterium solisilvae]|uniref:Glycosyltransferase family 2 protein n=1 Tax=Flavobacterium solisilvae TaxID=1852019 RepID=A0ABX1QV11_9FLAO|nr:glycosyltransferase family 2 protein [Flavobacterium solisilvae]NMH25330.1 glycosyltransferase family 2 protein [Flavobacterium solisilvae]